MVDPSIAIPIVVAIISGVAGYVATREKSKTDRDVSRGPEWDKFAVHQRTMINDLCGQLEKMEKQLADVRVELADVKATLDRRDEDYWTLVMWVREVKNLCPDLVSAFPPPSRLNGDLKI